MLPNPGTTAENDEAGAIIPAVISGQVAGTVIGFSQGSATGLFNGQYGADGPGSPAWSLTITGGGATGLTDTATNTAITLVAGVNGVVLGKANGGAGAVVFAFSVDASGNVTMVQYRAVNHGANEAAPGDHDEAIFMNSGVLGVTLKLTDFDGDAVSYTRDISGTVSIDDDGPHATCDYDSVTEGKGNTATGNVVTGAIRRTRISAPTPTAPTATPTSRARISPYTISKLTHGGHAYTLSADGLTVLKDGGPLGRRRDLRRRQADHHDGRRRDLRDHHGQRRPSRGRRLQVHRRAEPDPRRRRACRSGRHRCVAQHGVRHRRRVDERLHERRHHADATSAARFAIKNIDVNPKTGFGGAEDYRGIGVDTGIDSARSRHAAARRCTLKFAPEVPGRRNNAEVLIGALFDGVQFDAGNQEILQWEALTDGVGPGRFRPDRRRLSTAW